MEWESLGLIEFNSIASGIESMDQMVKRSPVELVAGRTICSGKYLVIVRGDVGAVEESVSSGIRTGEIHVVDSIVIPNLHSQIFPAISATTNVSSLGSLGVVEVFGAPSAIVAADHSAKAAEVSLIEIRIANGIGGKTFYSLTGDESSVRSAVEAGCDSIKDTGLFMKSVVIPAPDATIESAIL